MGLLDRLFGGKKQDQLDYPSWAFNEAKMNEFTSTLRELAKHKKIPERFVFGVFTTEYSINRLLSLLGSFEQQGVTYEASVAGAMAYIEKLWSNADVDDKERFINYTE